jgi:phage shock protein C
MTTTVKRLYKSRSDKMLNGVCGGIAEYFQVDSTLVRLGFLFLIFLGGLGLLLYVIAMLIVPSNPSVPEASGVPPVTKRDAGKVWGIVLIAFGGMLFLGNVGFPFWGWWHIPWGILLPAILIGAGIWFLVGVKRTSPVPAAEQVQPAAAAAATQTNGTSRLFRSRSDSKLFGVCGGIGAYLSTDPTLVRILFIIATFASGGLMLLLYVIMAIVVPHEPVSVSHA